MGGAGLTLPYWGQLFEVSRRQVGIDYSATSRLTLRAAASDVPSPPAARLGHRLSRLTPSGRASRVLRRCAAGRTEGSNQILPHRHTLKPKKALGRGFVDPQEEQTAWAGRD